MSKEKPAKIRKPKSIKLFCHFPADVIEIIYKVEPYHRVPFYTKVAMAKYKADGERMELSKPVSTRVNGEVLVPIFITPEVSGMLQQLVPYGTRAKMVKSVWLAEAIREFHGLADTPQKEQDEELLQSNNSLIGKRMVLIVDGRFMQGFTIHAADKDFIYIKTPLKTVAFHTPLTDMNMAVDANRLGARRQTINPKLFYALETAASRKKYNVK